MEVGQLPARLDLAALVNKHHAQFEEERKVSNTVYSQILV